ncbi:VWA domain-containing protein (plasmid) [Photobacterium sp. DA100]|uniref:vWA domain-containing protein n=1 Tax=Photobacterium sp. DA100 TaxID=3027472 RepID=UPI002478BA27|nr:VWA domain-containing protein [Photobacterium sp. DA100]WEM44303.1 VWA domain-containing protein [Photobacterium sp. DA100]
MWPDWIVNFHFLRPLWLLFLVPSLFIYWLVAREATHLTQWKKVMSPQIIEQLTIKGNRLQYLSPRLLLLPFLILSTIVLAGPSWYQQPSPFIKDDAVLIIALDLSQTMNSEDIQPSRLTRAKQKIIQLLERRGDTNTALIVYSGSAHIAMPVTDDRRMIEHFLGTLTPRIMPEKGKNPAAVVPLVDSLITSNDIQSTILLITDKSNPQASQAFKQKNTENPSNLVIWGFNAIDEGATTAMESMASENSGEFVAFAPRGEDVEKVDDAIRSQIKNAADNALPWYDSGYLLLLIIMIIQLFWFRKGWTIKW